MPRDYDDDDRPRRRPRRDEDDDDRPQVRKGRRDYDDEDDDDDRPRRKRKKKVEPQVSVLGVVSLATGVLALLLSLLPCIGVFGGALALIGLVLAIIGLVVARNSDGRQSPGLPVAGLAVNVVAIMIAVGWLLWFRKTVKDADRQFQDDMVQMQKEEAERKKELANAATQVKAANPDGVLRVTPAQFSKAYDDDDDRADAVYKNKVIELTGTVHELDFTGDTYTVHLKAGPEDTVNCEFAKDPEVRARLARLQPGQTVTIRGKCLGGSATLEACVVVEPAGE